MSTFLGLEPLGVHSCLAGPELWEELRPQLFADFPSFLLQAPPWSVILQRYWEDPGQERIQLERGVVASPGMVALPGDPQALWINIAGFKGSGTR